MALRTFSRELSDWLKDKNNKTYGALETEFGEKSFAVLLLILMAPSALPIPTGGITHILNFIAMVISLEMILGRRQIWTPKSWQRRKISNSLRTKALPKLVSFIDWFEKRSQKRLTGLMNHVWFLRFIGLVMFILALGAFVSPPFSGLDTLPALGAVIIALSMILDDALMLISGCFVGGVGIALIISLGSAALQIFF